MTSKVSKNIIKRVGNSSVWTLEDKCLKQVIKAEWGQHNHLLLTGIRPLKATSEDRPSSHAPCDSAIYDVKWDTILFGKCARSLVNESLVIFLSLSDSRETTELQNKEYITASLKYRCILSECVVALRQQNQTNDNNDIAAESLFYMLELVWNFCDIIFIDMPTGGYLLIKLIEWVQHHFDSVQKQISELYHFENPTEHQSYWDVVTTCILQGNISQARKLLKLHPNSSQDAFLCLEELLNKMPIYSAYSTMSLPEFGLRWHHWQAECESCLEDGIFLCYKNLQEICELLCGKKETFLKNKDLCQTWYHLLVSIAIYSNPCIKAIELQYRAKECIDAFGGRSKLSKFDSILLSAMEFDLENVIHLSCELDDAWWFATHFTNLVYKKGHVKEKIAASLHEYILMNYAGVLMSHCSLWQVGLEYLRFCPTLGKAHLETYLERIPISTEAKAFKLIAIANRNSLPQVAQGIAKVMAMRALQHSMLESAVSWAIRSQDSKLTSYLADRLLDQYCEKNDIACLELLDNLGPCYLINEKLAFLAKYREFYQLYKDEKYKGAAMILVSLVSMKLAPKKFWPTLFLHSIPLLEWEEPILSSSQTFQLLVALEELLACKPPVLTQAEIEKRLDTNLFRLALTRNLARTFISEAEAADCANSL